MKRLAQERNQNARVDASWDPCASNGPRLDRSTSRSIDRSINTAETAVDGRSFPRQEAASRASLFHLASSREPRRRSVTLESQRGHFSARAATTQRARRSGPSLAAALLRRETPLARSLAMLSTGSRVMVAARRANSRDTNLAS